MNDSLRGLVVLWLWYLLCLGIIFKSMDLWNSIPILRSIQFWGFIIGSVIILISTVASFRIEGLKDSKTVRNPLLIRQISIMTSTSYPGPWLYQYHSSLGEKLASIGLMCFIEVTNLDEVSTRITSYELKIKIGNKWSRIPSLTVLNPLNLFFGTDLTKCTRFDLTGNGFDINAMTTEIEKGESVRGWVFFEWPKELRNVNTDIEIYQYSLVDKQQRQSQIEINKVKGNPIGSSQIDVGTLKIHEKNVDISSLDILSHYELLEYFQNSPK